MAKLAGVVGFFDSPKALVEAAKKVREANYQSFDCFTPYPVHGLEHAQGLKRSPLPFVTMGAGLTGFMCAVALQGWTSVIDWPINVAGKPLWSWPAFVPIFFELTVLFAGLATVGAMFILNGFPNTSKMAFDPGITVDRLAIMVEAPNEPTAEELEDMDDDERAAYVAKQNKFKKFSPPEVEAFLKSLGAHDVKVVHAKGWFES